MSILSLRYNRQQEKGGDGELIKGVGVGGWGAVETTLYNKERGCTTESDNDYSYP